MGRAGPFHVGNFKPNDGFCEHFALMHLKGQWVEPIRLIQRGGGAWIKANGNSLMRGGICGGLQSGDILGFGG